MFKIGEFSRLSQVPVKTLRYYDAMGLLKPAQVDRFTDYRYYSAEQLPRLNRILAFKELGMTLDEIGRLLNEQVSLEQMRGMLRLKRAEIHERMQDDEARLTRIEARLRLIEQEDTMAQYEVLIKPIPAQRIASIRAIAPAYNQQDALWAELMGVMVPQEANITAPTFTMYYDDYERGGEVDMEVCWPTTSDIREQGRVRVRELPAVPQMASVVHHGTFDTLVESYQAMLRWLESNGYHVIGPARDNYLVISQPTRQDDPSYVTEVQFPVERAAS